MQRNAIVVCVDTFRADMGAPREGVKDFRRPQGPAAATCDEWVQNQILCPTLLGMLGIDQEPLDGFDLWPLCAGAGAPVRDHVLTGWGNNVCVRDGSQPPDRGEQLLTGRRGRSLLSSADPVVVM